MTCTLLSGAPKAPEPEAGALQERPQAGRTDRVSLHSHPTASRLRQCHHGPLYAFLGASKPGLPEHLLRCRVGIRGDVATLHDRTLTHCDRHDMCNCTARERGRCHTFPFRKENLLHQLAYATLTVASIHASDSSRLRLLKFPYGTIEQVLFRN